jgi:SAM-dependent methyltransferase
MAANKPNYGFDAPGVIRWLLIFTLVSLLIGYEGYSLLKEGRPQLALGLCIYFCFTALTFLISALWMIYSSLRAKAQILARLVSDLQLSGNERVLDVGCGRGMLLIEIAKRLTTGKAYGIDLWIAKDQSGNSSQNTLENARLEGVEERIELQTADMCELPFSDETFDLIVSSLAIHNLPTEEERAQALKEIFRTLKQGGRIALLDIRNTAEYARFFEENGGSSVKISPPIYHYCPPVRIVKVNKE